MVDAFPYLIEAVLAQSATAIQPALELWLVTHHESAHLSMLGVQRRLE